MLVEPASPSSRIARRPRRRRTPCAGAPRPGRAAPRTRPRRPSYGSPTLPALRSRARRATRGRTARACARRRRSSGRRRRVTSASSSSGVIRVKIGSSSAVSRGRTAPFRARRPRARATAAGSRRKSSRSSQVERARPTSAGSTRGPVDDERGRRSPHEAALRALAAIEDIGREGPRRCRLRMTIASTSARFDLRENSLERRQVPVDVVERRDAHRREATVGPIGQPRAQRRRGPAQGSPSTRTCSASAELARADSRDRLRELGLERLTVARP